MQEEVLEKMKRIVAEDHHDTLTVINNLALTYWKQERLTEAAKLQKEVL